MNGRKCLRPAASARRSRSTFPTVCRFPRAPNHFQPRASNQLCQPAANLCRACQPPAQGIQYANFRGQKGQTQKQHGGVAEKKNYRRKQPALRCNIRLPRLRERARSASRETHTSPRSAGETRPDTYPSPKRNGRWRKPQRPARCTAEKNKARARSKNCSCSRPPVRRRKRPSFFSPIRQTATPTARASVRGQTRKSTWVWAAAEKTRSSTPRPPAAAPRPCPPRRWRAAPATTPWPRRRKPAAAGRRG